MIISHKNSFIFFAVPKTGTHSIRQALRPHLDENDQEQVGLFVQKQLPYEELSRIGHGHISARQARPVIGPKQFDLYFKFAFVRNPFDRFVSYCAFMSRHNDAFVSDPRAFMRFVIRDNPPLQHILFRPQHELLVGENGGLLMDFVGKVETMQQDYDRLCERLGIPGQALERVNASSHGHYADYYDSDLVARVGDFYGRDLELFGYRFGDK